MLMDDVVTVDAVELRSRVQGTVVAPGDAAWDEARQAWNLRVDQRPALVAIPESAADVVAIVGFAREHGLRVAPQGTGHNASAIASLEGTILVKTSALRDVEIDVPARRARVGAGVLWAEVTGPASEHGLAPLAGSSPDVGVVGYTLGGGLSWLSRRHGLASNSVLAIELVTYPAPQVYAGMMLWPWEQATEVLKAYVAWCRTAPDAISTSARLLQVPPLPDIPEPVRGRQFVAIDGAYLGDEAAAAEALAPLRALG